MFPDELESRLRRAAAMHGYSYDRIVRDSLRRASQPTGFALDPTVLLERLLRHGLLSLERFVESRLIALEKRRRD